MIVEIKETLFNNANLKDLHYLIQLLMYKQRYTLFVEWTQIKNTRFYQKLDLDERLDIEENYNTIILNGVKPHYSISNKKSDFTIEEAIRFFNQPVSIVLENSLNDQYFLKAIIKYCDDSNKIEKYLDNGWIQFENAGGCTNAKNFIKGKLQSFNALSYQSGKEVCCYLRCFVLLDSDKRYPKAPIKEGYPKLLNFLNENDITYHVLKKRCMENYMPDIVFSSIANTPKQIEWLNAYNDLSENEKNFLNINGKFTKKCQEQREKLEEEVQALYSNLSSKNYEILNRGFPLPDFKKEFPKFFEYDQVDKDSLKSRCTTNELQEITAKIVKLL